MAEKRCELEDECTFSKEIQAKLEQLPVAQRQDIEHNVPVRHTLGIGTAELMHAICAYCRRRNMTECIERFCNIPTVMRADSPKKPEDKEK